MVMSNVRQVCEGGFGRRGMRRATERCETSNPSLEQLAMNAWRAPKRIRERHATHKIRKLGVDPWSTRPPAA